jgi:hypothetical protein
MKSRGLGDDIEKITKATGIKTMVEVVANKLNVPCGCSKRQEQLNKLLSYNRRHGRQTKEEI